LFKKKVNIYSVFSTFQLCELYLKQAAVRTLVMSDQISNRNNTFIY